MTQHILIVGGGVTGLTAAYRLQQQIRQKGIDARVTLVEKDDRLGGKTRTSMVDGMVIEHGPDSFIAHKPWFGQLLKELGLPTVGTNPKIKSTYIYHKGRLEQLPVGMRIMIPTEVWPFLKTPLISPLGKLRAAMEPLIPRKKDDADESIGEFVSRRFGREVLENIAGPLMGGIYGGDWDQVSIKATFAMFPKMEQKGSLLLQSWLKKQENKPKGPTGSMFLTVPTGLQSAVEALVAASEGVAYRTGTALTGLKPVDGGRAYAVTLDTGEELKVDAVVLATPAYVASQAVREFRPDVAAELDEIPYGNSCVVALAYNRKDVDHPLDASGFLVPMREPLDVTAATWVSSKWPHAAPEDKVLMRCFLGRSAGRDWTKEPDEVIVEATRRGLKQAMGLTADPILVKIFRWPRAMAGYRVGHLDRVARIDGLVARSPGLYLAGAAYRGVGLPDCVREGNEAAQKVARHLGWR